eukprot:scaffold379177_cov49-Attheya_sp.AAC.1
MELVVNEKVDRTSKNWLDGDDGIYYVLVNGTSGRGVDIFMALPLQDPSENEGTAMLLYVDQRKVVASPTLGQKTATALIDKAKAIVPSV